MATEYDRYLVASKIGAKVIPFQSEKGDMVAVCGVVMTYKEFAFALLNAFYGSPSMKDYEIPEIMLEFKASMIKRKGDDWIDELRAIARLIDNCFGHSG